MHLLDVLSMIYYQELSTPIPRCGESLRELRRLGWIRSGREKFDEPCVVVTAAGRRHLAGRS